MRRAVSVLRGSLVATIFAHMACSGSVSCGGCAGNTLQPIPGGFDPAAQIERAAQVRVTSRGFDQIEQSFTDLLTAYVSMECGAPDSVPCPTDFVVVQGGAANPSSCDVLEDVCVEQVSGAPGPLVGFEIERNEQSGAIVCRDDINDPNRRRCYAWLRFEALALAPQSPNIIEATLTAQIYSSDIPFRYNSLGMDCLVKIDSGASGSVLQDFVITAELRSWTPPSGSGGRQLDIEITAVDAQIPDMDVQIARDPVHGDGFDAALCGFANLGVVKNALIPRITGSLADIVGEEVDKALGMKCVGPTAEPCPAQTTCDVTDGLCRVNSNDEIVPSRLGFEGRMDFSDLLAGLTSGRPGEGDVSFLVGGQSTADGTGVTVGTLSGAEVVTPDPECATVLPSPRLRPGWTPPPALPAVEVADLDWDGTAETPFMMAAGISEALLDQYVWTIYTTGLFCTSISAFDVDLLNTGSLALIVPSLNKLTHADRYRNAIFPARVSLYPRSEPQVTLGSGKVDRSGASPRLEEPLIELLMDDLELNFYAMIEERWIRLMTVSMDLTLGFGAVATPPNQVELVLGDFSMSLSNVTVTNSEILAEDPAELEMAIPSLLQLALPQATTGFPPFTLPSGPELGGFVLSILGIRGVESSPGVYPNVAVYADISFDPALVPNLSLAAETRARVRELRLPRTEEFSVAREGGPLGPEVVLELGGDAPEGNELEHQIRVDGSLWTPFFAPADGVYVLRRPELLAEGRHRVEVRARIAGDYRSLDPTPEVIDLVIDVRPPELDVRFAPNASGVFVRANDVVSGENVRIEIGVGDVWRSAQPDADGWIAVPELETAVERVAIAAVDEAGHRNERVLREARSALSAGARAEDQGGCSCIVAPYTYDPTLYLGAVFVLFGAMRLRRPSTR